MTEGSNAETPSMKVTVVGAGTMGGGIATLLLMSGHGVALYDPSEEALERARGRAARRNDERALEERLTLTTDLAAAASGTEFVIETVPEVLDLKRDIFRQLDEVAPAGAILASNTSELSVTAIAGATNRAAQVVGMHWFNPPERM